MKKYISWPWVLILILVLALSFRLFGIWFGLPGTFHADEPHHVNLAVYFGSGDLNPHVFKYPTLWMYFLFFLYGVFFIFWSGFGLLHSSADFAALFVWDPSWFYLIARGASAVLGTAAIVPVYWAARRWAGERSGLLAAGILAFSSRLVYLGHLAKPDMLMLFWAAMGWWLCARIYDGERRFRDYLAAGTALGLACSSQYTAVLIVPLILWAHFLGGLKKGQSLGAIIKDWGWVLGHAAMKIAFFIGTPFAILDWRTFWRDFHDLGSYAGGVLTQTPERLGWGVLKNFMLVLGWDFYSALDEIFYAFCLVGLIGWWTKDKKRALFIGVPLIGALMVLAMQSAQAGSERYLISLLPGMALLLSGVFLEKFSGKLLLIFLLVPGFLGSLFWDRQYLGQDTRLAAKKWIEERVASGTKILLDQAHASPPIKMSKAQVERLHEKTRLLGHPRAKYYGIMLGSHPGGGYEIYRISRTAGELISMQRHTQWSQQAYDLLDVEEGLPALQKAGIRYVVLCDEGATVKNSPRLSKFFEDLRLHASLIRLFMPQSGKIHPQELTGPFVKIYEIPFPEAQR